MARGRAHAIVPGRYVPPSSPPSAGRLMLTKSVGCYIQLIRLYRKLGIKFAERDFTYSFVRLTDCSGSSPSFSPNFIYNGANGTRGVSFPSNLASSATSFAGCCRNYVTFVLWALAAFVAYLRLLWLCAPSHRPADMATLTLEEWTTRTLPRGPLARLISAEAHWRAFVAEFLIPLFSGICTAPVEDIWDHPAEELIGRFTPFILFASKLTCMIDYIWSTIFTPHYVAANGVREVTSALSATIPHIHLGSSITRLSADPTNAALATLELDNGQTYRGFTHVIFATQANSAARILKTYMDTTPGLGSANDQQMEHALRALQTFRYLKNIVVNHSDDNLLAPMERDRRELNLATWATSMEKSSRLDHESLQVSRGYTMATHVLVGPEGAEAVYQTTNPIVPIKPSTITSVARMERAVLTLQSKSARRAFTTAEGEIGAAQGVCAVSGGPRVWFCGSYVGDGIPLLEGCVVSARIVVEQGIYMKEGVRACSKPW
jgi:predicted NAD/FAD-binding protein